MYPLVVMIAAGLLMALVVSLAQQYASLATLYFKQTREMYVNALAARIEHFVNINDALPASLSTLSSTAGYEDVKGLFEPTQAYAVSATINDGRWRFQRAVLFTRSTDVTPGAYLSTNTCGSGSATAATTVSWCGTKTSRWFRRETRTDFSDQINMQRARLNRTLHKLSTAFNVSRAFVGKDSGGTALVGGNVYSLAALAGYAGSATACIGPFTLNDGTPLDCGDLFDRWGQAVAYQYNSPTYVILFSESPIVSASGNAVVIASELDASSL